MAKNHLIPQNKNEIHEIVEKLETFGAVKVPEMQKIREYKKALQDEVDYKELTIKHSTKPEIAEQMVAEVEAELEWIENVQIYTNSTVSLLDMNGLVMMRIFGMINTGYTTNPFFDFKELVEKVNAYFEIAEPYKPSNKIAYGWKFCMDKGEEAHYKPCRLYLFGCIKNYLIKNGVEFGKEESLKVRKIVGLVEVYDSAE